MGAMWVVGVGPRKPEYITVEALKLIERADYVAGFKQALQVVEKQVKNRMLVIDYSNEKEILKRLASEAKTGRKCVICCYGDPNFSDKQFIEKIKKVHRDVKVVLGVSSVQASCAKAGLGMEELIFITFHKSGPINNEKEELLRYVKEGQRNVIVLPRPWDFMPEDIAKFLIDNCAAKNLEVTIHEKLTLSDEIVHECKLSDVSNAEYSDMPIVIIKKRRGLSNDQKVS
jgi:cobalt-precorrin-7 (C5)-methyltransferase